MEALLIFLVLVSGLYMSWSIGANDVANAMGTSVGSNALTLRQAVVLAAFLEFFGAFFFGGYVTETVQTGIIRVDLFASDPFSLGLGMLASLISCGIWLQTASYYGWPVSTTHTIVGSIVGFGLLSQGVQGILWRNVFYILSSWIFSPILGGFLAFFLFSFLRRKIFYSYKPVAAAKFWAPFLLGVLVFSFSLFMFFAKSKESLASKNSLLYFLLAALFALLSSAILFFFVRSYKDEEGEPIFIENQEEVRKQLEKAKRHLFRVQNTSSGDLHFTVSSLINQLEEASIKLPPKQPYPEEHFAYEKVEKIFGYLQIVTAAFMAFSHGANDVANAIGPLSSALTIFTTHSIPDQFVVSYWLLALGGFGIVLGLATWGWRVIETIGKKITELTPTRGFAAEFGAATTIIIASRFGMPISTTHTLVGAVIGVGLGRGIQALNLETAKDIFISWFVTVPFGAFLTMILYSLFNLIF